MMTRKHLRKFVLVACVALLGVTSTAAVPMTTTSRITVSSGALSRYASTHALSDLQSAILGLSGTIDPYSLTPQNFNATRRTLVQSWAPVIKAVEDAYEPGYDPNDPKNVPSFCAPPPVPDQTVCTQAMVEQNNAKRLRANHYAAVNHLDELAMGLFEVSVRTLNEIAPTGEGADFNALDGILRSDGISNGRMSKLDAMLYEGSVRTQLP